MLFLVGGYDTVASSLTASIYFCHKHPSERTKIKDLLSKVNPVPEELDQIDEFNYFIKEC